MAWFTREVPLMPFHLIGKTQTYLCLTGLRSPTVTNRQGNMAAVRGEDGDVEDSMRDKMGIVRNQVFSSLGW